MTEAEFDLDQAHAMIWWLVHLLGGKVTIPSNPEFGDDNLPESFRVMLEPDQQGNAVLIAARRDWVI